MMQHAQNELIATPSTHSFYMQDSIYYATGYVEEDNSNDLA